ncbi:hypothetical protein QOZ80_6BG0504360 [Eleusine coracana subsp. coracana]|nr:hypothetical protein QOZ80_6BG0504360 [Eleusine coracana subsp. coracana]
MEAAVSLQHHHHGLPAALPPAHHHHRSSLPVPVTQTSIRRPCVRSSSSKPPPPAACLTQTQTQTQTQTESSHSHAVHATAAVAGDHNYSSRAATGYAAALADACARAGTLRRASTNARAILSRRPVEEEEVDARVAALVRMLVGKGKAAMVPEVMADFAAICHNLLLPRAARSHAY